MLWFRLGAVVALTFTLFLSFGIGISCFIMSIGPGGDREMDTEPYYNGTLALYIVIILAEACELSSTIFGFILAFRVWKNNHQMDHSLRHLFTIWLACFGISTVVGFIAGILGLVRYREPREEITTLYEIFAKYSQDVKFVGSFERFQRENSCCGINGAEDWYYAQVKNGGFNPVGMGMGMGMEMGYMGMGSPSTGKCHLSPPTIPMGCGKKMLEVIHYTQHVYCGLLIVQTISAVVSAGFAWYCFFYWIEKEVIIIPEDEVSNLIVIGSEFSSSTMRSSRSTVIPVHWSGSKFSSNGNQYISYTKPRSKSRYSSSSRPSKRSNLESSKLNRKSKKSINNNNASQFGPIPSIGGPNVEYHFPDRNGALYSYLNHNLISPSEHSYEYRRFERDETNSPTEWSGESNPQTPDSNSPEESYSDVANHRSKRRKHDYSSAASTYRSSNHNHNDSSSTYIGNKRKSFKDASKSSHHHFENERDGKSKKKHSFNNQNQVKALGGKMLAKMHIDHMRDKNSSRIILGQGQKGHHNTIALIKNKKAPKPKMIIGGPQKGHGQTGRLAEDIIDMSRGAAAVKSLVHNVNFSGAHDLRQVEGYVNRLHRAHRKTSQSGHPDPHHPGHGPVHRYKNGAIAAPSIDGSQAQILLDTAFHPKPRPPSSKHAIEPHDVHRHHHRGNEGNHHHRHHNQYDDRNYSKSHHKNYSHQHDQSYSQPGHSMSHRSRRQDINESQRHHHHLYDSHRHNRYHDSTEVLFKNPNQPDKN